MRLSTTKSRMRADLAACVSGMRRLRKAVLTDGRIDDERREEYRDHIALAASFAEALEDKGLTDPLKRTVAERCNADPALLKYDPLQDGWWSECGQDKAFLDAIQVLSAYYLRGGLSLPEDVFHVFQIAKYFLETDRGERKRDDFVLPAYCGLALPRMHLGPLLSSMTGNPHLIPDERQTGAALSLDWFPDPDAAGCQEVAKALEAAAKLGFPGVEFTLADGYGYEELYLRYPSLSAELDAMKRWRAAIPCPRCNPEPSRESMLFQATELQGMNIRDGIIQFRPERVRKVFECDPQSGTNSVYIFGGGGLLALAYADLFGFATRVRYTLELWEGNIGEGKSPSYSIAAGVYSFGNKDHDPGLAEALGFLSCLNLALSLHKNPVDLKSVMETVKSDIGIKEGQKKLVYMVVRSGEGESDFEGMSGGSE
jgi:hypothetical protein